MAGIDSYAKLVSNFNGSNGQTTYTAETGQEITFANNAQLSTASKQFGSASLLLDGNADYCSVPASADWNFGTGDLTIETWFKRVGAGQEATEAILSQYDAGGTNTWAFYYNGGTFVLYVWTSSTLVTFDYTPNTDWHHIAVVRSGTTWYMFLDGTAQTKGTDTIAGNSVGDSTKTLFIGNQNASYNRTWNGYFDTPRISKGIARWTSNFTPPTEEYTADAASSGFLSMQKGYW